MLRDSMVVGDEILVDDQMSFKLKMTISAPGQGEQTIDFASNEQSKYTEKVLAVGSSGRMTAVRRVYKVARTEETNPDGKSAKTKSLEGKTIEIRTDGTKVTITSPDGKLDPKDEEDLRKIFKDGSPSLFPDHPVAIGETWTVDPKAASIMFKGADDISMKMKLAAVETYQGRKCAKIELYVGLSGKFGDSPLKGTMKLAGVGYHALDANIPLIITAIGPFEMNGEFTQGGVTSKLEGKGTFQGRLTNQILQLGPRKKPDANGR
jgi:hypothetical protein